MDISSILALGSCNGDRHYLPLWKIKGNIHTLDVVLRVDHNLLPSAEEQFSYIP